jgi:hypothetical protein
MLMEVLRTNIIDDPLNGFIRPAKKKSGNSCLRRIAFSRMENTAEEFRMGRMLRPIWRLTSSRFSPMDRWRCNECSGLPRKFVDIGPPNFEHPVLFRRIVPRITISRQRRRRFEHPHSASRTVSANASDMAAGAAGTRVVLWIDLEMRAAGVGIVASFNCADDSCRNGRERRMRSEELRAGRLRIRKTS